MPEGSTQIVEQKRTVPVAAMVFNVGQVQFAAAGGGDGGDADSKKVPITLLGRTGKPISHWYWGNVVHDMAGMKLAHDSLPIDYCHFPDEILGYLNQFDTSTGDLVAKGELIPYADGDRASEVTFKAKNGVPYEASINFAGGPLRLEELQAGTSVQVNGNTVQGPALIIREWTLRGIAVCPYGADMNTKTELSAKGEQPGGTIEVTLFKAGDMPNKESNQQTDQAKPGDEQKQQLTQKPAETPAAPPSPQKAELSQDKKEPAQDKQPPKQGAEFVTAFGDVGARWYLEGRQFSECATEFIAAKDKKISELSAEVEKLKEQLAEAPRGNEAVSFKAGSDSKTAPLPKGVRSGAAAVVASAMSARKQQNA